MFSRFFIDRPIFATVLSIAITLAGAISLFQPADRDVSADRAPTVERDLPVSRRERQVVAETIAAPIEQQVNGVENMMYMSSQCTNDGSYSLTVTFRNTVDLNLAQVLVQNRVALAVPNLPDVIKATGVMTKKQAPTFCWRSAFIHPMAATTSSTCQTTPRSSSSPCFPGCRASATSGCSGSATTACGSGSIPTSLPPAG